MRRAGLQQSTAASRTGQSGPGDITVLAPPEKLTCLWRGQVTESMGCPQRRALCSNAREVLYPCQPHLDAPGAAPKMPDARAQALRESADLRFMVRQRGADPVGRGDCWESLEEAPRCPGSSGSGSGLSTAR